MSRFPSLLSACVVVALVSGPALAEKLGLGRAALPEEIQAWDQDILPDGTGLPEGMGDVLTGEELFSENCASCHGEFGEGVDNWPELAGGVDTLGHDDPVKTVGSYWPYLSTVWDYVNRSMPFGNAQSLEVDEVYAIVAYILYSNDLVGEDFVLSKAGFLDVEMPNADGFRPDDRAKTEYPAWSGEPCMRNCKESVEITMRARVLDVTPEEDTAEADAVDSPVSTGSAEAPVPAFDAELASAGAKVFRKCKACHQVGAEARHRVGPTLNGVVNAAVGKAEGFRYSKVMVRAGQDGLFWSEDELDAYLASPRKYLKGNRMNFSGLKKPEDRTAVIEYLKSFPE